MRLISLFRPAVLGLVLLALPLAGCITVERPEASYPETRDFYASGFKDARFSTGDPDLRARLEVDIRKNLASGRKAFDVLALSGGGADGAFGAGLLIGWTARGDRPEFRVVTGVSTGALIAPFAFLGPKYDAKLREAYTEGVASELGETRGLLSLFTPGFLSSNKLQALVDRYVDVGMVTDIAKEHAKGRRLVVATTNLDTQTGVVWDIGGIAQEAVASGNPKRLIAARDLIRQVLVASASVPGAFAPVMIDTERDHAAGVEHFREMHTDGSVTMPFFLLPESLMNWQLPPDLFDNGHVYVIINGKINPQPSVTPINAISIMARSLDTMTKAQARTTLYALQGFAERNGVGFSVESLPDEFIEGGMLAFDMDSMRRVFYFGYQLGASDKLWKSTPSEANKP